MEKNLFSILSDEFCEEQAFPHVSKGKFGYRAPRDISISTAHYFNQSLVNVSQHFASDAYQQHISVYQQYH